MGALALRTPRPGDYGWVIQRHGALYAEEYGFDISFEALVARVVADFAQNHDTAREARGSQSWTAYPWARSSASMRVPASPSSACCSSTRRRAAGNSDGDLVEECVAFARTAGYRELTLWTQRQLEAARSIYVRAGFELVEQGPPTEQFGTRRSRRPGGSCSEGVARPIDTRRECHLAALTTRTPGWSHHAGDERPAGLLDRPGDAACRASGRPASLGSRSRERSARPARCVRSAN